MNKIAVITLFALITSVSVAAGSLTSVEGIHGTSPEQVEKAVGYKLTRFSSVSEVEAIFRELKPWNNTDFQCHENVYVGQYELSTLRNIQTAKLFIIWGEDYRKAGRLRWWYQTAILTFVGDQPYVLDPYAYEKPMTLVDWARSWGKRWLATPSDCTLGTPENYRKAPDGKYWKTPSGTGLDVAEDGCTLWFAPEFEFHPSDRDVALSFNHRRSDKFIRILYERVGKKLGRLDDSGQIIAQ